MATQLEAAKNVLRQLYRHSLKDLYFGDAEVYWTAEKEGGKELACGYDGSKSRSVSVTVDGQCIEFEGDEARQLIDLGKPGKREYN